MYLTISILLYLSNSISFILSISLYLSYYISFTLFLPLHLSHSISPTVSLSLYLSHNMYLSTCLSLYISHSLSLILYNLIAFFCFLPLSSHSTRLFPYLILELNGDAFKIQFVLQIKIQFFPSLDNKALHCWKISHTNQLEACLFMAT